MSCPAYVPPVTVPPADAETTMLDHMPVEILVQVFLHLDMATAHGLATTSRRFANIFAAHRTTIVLRIAEAEFTPFDGLLQVVKASASDLGVPWGTWLYKRVRRRNVVLCPGGTPPTTYARRTAGQPKISCAQVTLEDADIDRLLAVCRTVRGWERIFPQYRFCTMPCMTRSLTPRENFRLRRALYAWMRYAFYFHGDLPRPNVFYPAGRDVRVNQVRALSNDELSELKDLWMTAEDMIEMSICPSIDSVRMGADAKLTEKDAARIGWGRQRENRLVVATMRKLPPDELLYYLDHGHNFTKVRLIQDVRRRHPGVEADIESLTHALAAVVSERWRQTLFDLTAATTTTTSDDPDGDGDGQPPDPLANALLLPVFSRVAGRSGGGILDWTGPEAEACVSNGDMTGLGLSWQPENALYQSRSEIPRGLLDL